MLVISSITFMLSHATDKDEISNMLAVSGSFLESANQDRLWIETPYINPVNELLKKYIPIRPTLNSDEFITTSNPEEVFIKKTNIDIDPSSWGIENVNWFYWSKYASNC
mgnify:CR=1 FL=1